MSTPTTTPEVIASLPKVMGYIPSDEMVLMIQPTTGPAHLLGCLISPDIIPVLDRQLQEAPDGPAAWFLYAEDFDPHVELLHQAIERCTLANHPTVVVVHVKSDGTWQTFFLDEWGIFVEGETGESLPDTDPMILEWNMGDLPVFANRHDAARYVTPNPDQQTNLTGNHLDAEELPALMTGELTDQQWADLGVTAAAEWGPLFVHFLPWENRVEYLKRLAEAARRNPYNPELQAVVAASAWIAGSNALAVAALRAIEDADNAPPLALSIAQAIGSHVSPEQWHQTKEALIQLLN